MNSAPSTARSFGLRDKIGYIIIPEKVKLQINTRLNKIRK